MAPRHPLASLSQEETNIARDVVLAEQGGAVVDFRTIALQEPVKAELVRFLDLEHAGKLTTDSPRPQRLARVHYDAIDSSKVPKYLETIVDVNSKKVVSHEIISSDVHACLTM